MIESNKTSAFLKDVDKNNDIKLFGQPEEYDYSKYSKIDGFELDNELTQKFAQIAKKLDLSQDSAEMLLEIALEMSQKQDTMRKDEKDKEYEATLQGYEQTFMSDVDLPKLNTPQFNEYMKVADSAYSEFASPELKEVLTEKGLIYHPEMIKMFFKLGELMGQDNLSYGGKPSNDELTPAQILYSKRD